MTILTIFYTLIYLQLKRIVFQLVPNSAARAITNTVKLHHITLILESLHLLKINERIKYKITYTPSIDRLALNSLN